MVYTHADKLNNLEGRQGTVAFHIDAVAVDGKRSEDHTMLANGDLVLLGHFPRGSMVTDLRAFIGKNPFPAGTTFDIGFPLYTDGEITDISDIVTGMVVSSGDRTIVIPMPIEGLVTPENILYTGDRGSIYCGEALPIAMRVNTTGDIPTDAVAEVLVLASHSYFGTRQGEYIK